ncbi:relaxosome protein TraM [Serratia marcescens]|uniref:relaxosome protein TraM n=1 Tax=Serratia marcescens TaxID=615 RepID=UPI0039838540
MSDEFQKRANRVNLTVPFSFLEKIDHHVQARLDDGETRDTANRAAFVMEMFKLGLRVHENKLNKDENQKSLDDKLKLIAGNVLLTSFLSEALYFVMQETSDKNSVVKCAQFIDDDFVSAVKERIAGKLAEFFK